MATRRLWQQATPLLEAEVVRVGAGLARGSFDVLIDGMYPKGHVQDDRWFVVCLDEPMTVDPGMVVAPVVGGHAASFLVQRDNTARYLAYPLPRARRALGAAERPSGEDLLAATVGEPRAEILRRLELPVTAGSLATSLLLAPSAITHHLGALERAGLVGGSGRDGTCWSTAPNGEPG